MYPSHISQIKEKEKKEAREIGEDAGGTCHIRTGRA
jgi:hypothetical protein